VSQALKTLKTPLFITFEGGEGAGKTTLIQRLQKLLEEEGYAVLVTREPGGSLLSEKIRQIVLHHDKGLKLGARAELLLFLAARAQHIEELILPALQAGKIVLCDRFNDSSVAYQGFARGLGMETVENISLFATQNLQPNLTFFLDLDPEVGIKRALLAERTLDAIESQKKEFHALVRKGFLEIAKKHPERMKTLDASKTPDVVFEQAVKYLNDQ
jgi:dTMP kinase